MLQSSSVKKFLIAGLLVAAIVVFSTESSSSHRQTSGIAPGHSKGRRYLKGNLKTFDSPQKIRLLSSSSSDEFMSSSSSDDASADEGAKPGLPQPAENSAPNVASESYSSTSSDAVVGGEGINEPSSSSSDEVPEIVEQSESSEEFTEPVSELPLESVAAENESSFSSSLDQQEMNQEVQGSSSTTLNPEEGGSSNGDSGSGMDESSETPHDESPTGLEPKTGSNGEDQTNAAKSSMEKEAAIAGEEMEFDQPALGDDDMDDDIGVTPESQEIPDTQDDEFEKIIEEAEVEAQDEEAKEDESLVKEVEEVEEELEHEEKVARTAGGFGFVFAIGAMIFTAHQMSENPDGIFAR